MSQARDLTRLSKTMAYALRHRPSEFGLAPDADGYVPVDELVGALRGREALSWVRADDVAAVVAGDPKGRYELSAGRVRALYGHSFGAEVAHERVAPPDVLWHGTSWRAWGRIRDQGLLPMGRQFVHLSADEATALSVGARHERGGRCALLRVDAARARAGGVEFFLGNKRTYLARAVPARYLELAGDRPSPAQ